MILIIIIKSLIIRHISPGLIGVLHTEIRLVEGEKLLNISAFILIHIIFNVFNLAMQFLSRNDSFRIKWPGWKTDKL